MLVKNQYEELYTYPQIDYYEGKTMRYLLPALGMRIDKLLLVINNIHFSAIDILRYIGLKGIYYSWEECPDKWENEVYMVFNPKRAIIYTSFPLFYNYIKKTNNFLNLYHVNNNFIIIVLKIDEKWKHAKNVIKEGKYSKLGKVYANNFFNVNGTLKKEFHIICKTDDYRRKIEIELGLDEDYLLGDELDEAFDIQKETLNLQKLNIEYKRL